MLAEAPCGGLTVPRWDEIACAVLTSDARDADAKKPAAEAVAIVGGRGRSRDCSGEVMEVEKRMNVV